MKCGMQQGVFETHSNRHNTRTTTTSFDFVKKQKDACFRPRRLVFFAPEHRPSDDDRARASLRQQREDVQTGYSRGRGVADDDASAAGRDLERQAGDTLIPTTRPNPSGPGGSSSVNITEGEPTTLQPAPSTLGGLGKGFWQLAKLVLTNKYFGPLIRNPAIRE